MTKEQLIKGKIYSITWLACISNSFPKAMFERFEKGNVVFLLPSGEEVYFLFKELQLLNITEL